MKEKRPNGELNVNNFELSSSTGICQYPFDASNFIKYFGLFISENISSAVGSLKSSFLSLCSGLWGLNIVLICHFASPLLQGNLPNLSVPGWAVLSPFLSFFLILFSILLSCQMECSLGMYYWFYIRVYCYMMCNW